MNWSLALTMDWNSMNPVLDKVKWTDLVMTRARHPNMLMGAREFDTKLSEARELSGNSICTHPRKHKDPFTGTKEEVDKHKIVCWVVTEDSEKNRRDWEEMDL